MGCSQTAASTSNELNIHLGHLKTLFSYTAQHPTCLLPELYQSFGAPGQYERTLIHESLWAVHVKIPAKPTFPLVYCTLDYKPVERKDLNLSQLLLFLFVCEESPRNFSLGPPLQQANEWVWQHPSPAAQSPVQPELTLLCAESLGTG